MQESGLRRTPFHPLYERYEARTFDYAGWEMPLQFTGIVEEHQAVRTAAGLFDVSHMGEIELRGTGALTALQRLVTNDLAKITPGRVMYSPMCRDDGGIVDDLLIFCLDQDRFLLVVNAANIEKDFQHVAAVAGAVGQCQVSDVTDAYAVLALQGPRAAGILGKVLSVGSANATEAGEQPSTDDRRLAADLKPFRFIAGAEIAGHGPVLVARTGYTGEDGFELYMPPELAAPVWEALLEAGSEDRLVPCGLGARDTLRFEACLPLYGNELTEETNPLEAGLERFVKFAKDDFVGRAALLRAAEQGLSRRLVGLEMIDRGLPRQGYTVNSSNGMAIGFVTSGGRSPTLGRHLALAYVDIAWSEEGSEVDVVIRGAGRRARVVATPFYRRQRP